MPTIRAPRLTCSGRGACHATGKAWLKRSLNSRLCEGEILRHFRLVGARGRGKLVAIQDKTDSDSGSTRCTLWPR